jgi:DNA-binding XRE family transcriptional regulator
MEKILKLGKLIEEKRIEQNLTQKDLASIAQISDTTLRMIEKGKPTVAIGNWVKVADILGMDITLIIKKMSDESRVQKPLV